MSSEYMIYTYDRYCEDKIGYNQWQCPLSGHNAVDIVTEAERLFETGRFQKIEIKKKFFDKKSDHYAVSTFRVLDDSSNKKTSNIEAMILITLAVSLAGFIVLEML